MNNRHRLPPPSAPVAVLATLGLAATFALLTPDRSGSTDAVPLTIPERGGLALHAVFQLEDCAATVAAFDILDHPTLSGRVRLETLVLIGDPGQAGEAIRRLGHRALGRRLVTAGPHERRAFRAMGFRTTPFFYIADDRGSIRLASGVPSGPHQLRALHATLSALADNELRRTRGGGRAT